MSRNPIKSNLSLEGSSFRDPSGFIFYHRGILYRQINYSYKANYQQLVDSGLLSKLHRQKLLVPHQEVTLKKKPTPQAFKVIKPEFIPFISYPYGWCFSQLKDAALTTLKIQQLALSHNMSLKDASAYNIQFHQGRPLFIDTLSFEKYNPRLPWVAYKQYCQHFLAPLSLMAYTDIRLSKLLRIYIDGIPLDLASRLLSIKTYFKGGLATHIHLHARSQKKYAHTPPPSITKTRHLTKLSMLGLIDNLISTTQKLTWKHSPQDTQWGDYYNITNYSKTALDHKKQVITQWVKRVQPTGVWDLGANDGRFSRIASHMGIPTVAFDIDPIAVEKNYLLSKQHRDIHMHPSIIDLTNPSPAIGWANTERKTLIERGPVDLIFALALVHHLTITNNVPPEKIAEFFSMIGKHLIIEFVPKEDSKVNKLLATRKDIFPNYTQKGFESALAPWYKVLSSQKIQHSTRILYLCQNKRTL